VGRELGLVGSRRWLAYSAKREAVDVLRGGLAQRTVTADSPLAIEIGTATGERITKDTTLLGFLKRPGVALAGFASVIAPHLSEQAQAAVSDAEVGSQVEVEAKYEGYIRRQEDEIAKVRRHESIELPLSMDFANLEGLSNELKQKLIEGQPPTLARAARIPGMTAAGLSVLLVHARRLRGRPQTAQAGG
jgi:tRNA uridine 5-carboxymethylaminomethyl modification enzyme